ncbi:MAG: DNA phosphorothioation-associated putative methyltransferase [Silvania sp.]|uniref:DNA phosphorothioation-associated putative methyltransferase n=1 Tax=Silvania sp. TaxID=3016633 RepID=UPI003EE648CB
MNEELFAKLISQIRIGKQLPDAIYIHRDAFSALPDTLRQFIWAVAKAVKLEDSEWNLVKLFKKEFRVSLLHYPDFYSDSYPSLRQSLNVDLKKLSHRITKYDVSDNPPILHRKETMILPDNEYFQHFRLLTQEGEDAGLYANSHLIGFKISWNNLISHHGYSLVDGRIVRSKLSLKKEKSIIDRYKTALVRYELSSPIKSLVRHDYLNGSYSIFDYGCGRGDDIRELEAHGLDVSGWDPNFRPDSDKVSSDIINLGFVLNVIEDQDERLEALLGAWELTDKFLIVSVMLANEAYISKFKPYKDGVVTTRNTFQKYYYQSEIKSYIERNLHEEAIAVSPGIFYVFKDKLEEQLYLQGRYKRHFEWKQLTSSQPLYTKDKVELVISTHKDLFDSFWKSCLELGRVPLNHEYVDTYRVKELIGSNKKAFNILNEIYDISEFNKAKKSRHEDLLLYFAMELFGKRKAYNKQPDSLKLDIKTFFLDYNNAINNAKELLFAIADTILINEQCKEAYSLLPASILNEGHSLILHRSYIDDLPLLLRVYVGAGLQMYGELGEDIDLLKIHITSGKLTLMAYDDFTQPVPFLRERIKIKMSAQEIDFFDYIDNYKRPPLLNKHLLININDVEFEKQKSFDKRLSKLLCCNDHSEVLMQRQQYDERLNISGKKINGFKIISR